MERSMVNICGQYLNDRDFRPRKTTDLVVDTKVPSNLFYYHLIGFWLIPIIEIYAKEARILKNPIMQTN